MRREAADLQQRAVYITGSPHGVAHNNHRRLLRGYGSNLQAPISLYIVSVWNGSIIFLLSYFHSFPLFLPLVAAGAFNNFSRNENLTDHESISQSKSLGFSVFRVNKLAI